MSGPSHTCPQGHRSESGDFCSVCGAEIAGAAASSPPPPPPTGPTPACPRCGTPTDAPGQVFCEVCGHNFKTGGTGVPPLPTAGPPTMPTPAGVVPAAPSPPPPAAGAVRWDLIVEVDPSLYGTLNPDAPVGSPVQTFTLFDDESLLGRGGTEVRVQVPIRGDVGVSRRQALFVRRPDGTLTVRDLGSANGTQLNGRELVAGVDTALADGDVVGVGAWTRVVVREVPR